jgi:sugar-specific transcriptional regulator TrmB
MEWSDLVGTMARFGLEEREAKLYLAALRRGRATASELTKEAGVDRVLGYRLLDRLRSQGLMEVTAERPRRYAPVSPTTLVERDLRSRRRRLTEDEAIAREFVEHLATQVQSPTTGAPRYQLLVGATQVYDHLQDMVGRAREGIDVMLTFHSLRASIEQGLQARIGPFVSGGGRVRMILEGDPRLRPTLARFRKVSRRHGNAQFRERSPQPTRLTIVDGKEALVFLVSEARDHHGDEVAVWTDHPKFVGGQQIFFDRIWAEAAPSARGAPKSPSPAHRGTGTRRENA